MTLTTSHIHVLKVMEIGANTVSPLCPNGMKMEVLSLHFWNSVAILEHLIFTNHSYNLYKTLKIQNPQDTKLQCYDLWLAYPIQFFFFISKWKWSNVSWTGDCLQSSLTITEKLILLTVKQVSINILKVPCGTVSNVIWH